MGNRIESLPIGTAIKLIGLVWNFAVFFILESSFFSLTLHGRITRFLDLVLYPDYR